jgi:hypothetical protein
MEEEHTTVCIETKKRPKLKIVIKPERCNNCARIMQSVFRGYLFRKKRLPNALYTIQKILKEHQINFCKTNEDGRVNSCMDQDEIENILKEKMQFRIRIPEKKTRMWYDILVLDYKYGWLPVNIKSTTTSSSDNTGNLAMCVYAYTNERLDLSKGYQNGNMSKLLIDKLNKKEYNFIDKKDYYFVVVNKNDNNDIIVNSVKGLTELTPNINNLPFQVCWNKNRQFVYKNIHENIKLFLDALQKPKPSWQEVFLKDIRAVKL